MKKIFLLILIIASSKVNAQINAGIFAAFTTSSVKIDDIPSDFTNTIEGSDLKGFEAGLFLKGRITAFYIKPMALLHYSHGNISADMKDANAVTEGFSLSKFEIPILAGLNIIGPLSIEAGPVFNYLITSTDNFNGHEITLDKSGSGYRAGISAEFNRISLTISYQGIRNNNSSSAVSALKIPNELIFGAGLKFGSRK
jgi:hypothetical protein